MRISKKIQSRKEGLTAPNQKSISPVRQNELNTTCNKAASKKGTALRF